MSDKTRESSLWAWLKGSLPKLSAQGIPNDVQRIENLVGVGTPDVEGCIAGGQFWIELKVATERTSGTHVAVAITKHQVFRALRRTEAGGRSFVLVRVGVGRAMRHYLIPGGLSEELLKPSVALEWLERHSAVDPHWPPARILLEASRL